MTIKQFEVNMLHVGDRMLEGVMVNVTVDTETNEITAEYTTQVMRDWTESRGAEGTADYWLGLMVEMLKDTWQDYL